MGTVVVSNLLKSFDEGAPAVAGIEFVVPDGTLTTLLGPSGCGKTTTLKAIAGLVEPTSGRISIGDKVVYDDDRNVPIEQREIGMVFQSYAIWPHRTVFENVEFPLRVKRRGRSRVGSKSERRDRVMEVLQTVGLEKYADRYPGALSGGQQQRAVLARALVYQPRVLLLDEPLANLDAKLREVMRREIREVQLRAGITAIYVTHDQQEAMAISDQIVVMQDGNIMQQGTPRQVVRHPANEFVASFFSGTNLFRAVVTAHQAQNRMVVQVDGWEKPLLIEGGDMVGTEVSVAVRPKSAKLCRPAETDAENTVAAVVDTVVYLGDEVDIVVVTQGEARLRVLISADAFESELWEKGDLVTVILNGVSVISDAPGQASARAAIGRG